MYLAKSQQSGSNNSSATKLNMVMNEKVKKALNLWTTWDLQSDEVFKTLHPEFVKPVTDIGKSN